MIEVPCVGCGRRAVHWHHPEARDLSGRHFSPRFRIPLCQTCHNLVHLARSHGGLDDLANPFVGIRRCAGDFVLIGERRGAELVILPAASLLECGLALHAALARAVGR